MKQGKEIGNEEARWSEKAPVKRIYLKPEGAGRSEPCTVLEDGHRRQGWRLELSAGESVAVAVIGR